ncbi:kinase-like protein [Coniophora puteana RWD-64-598 SS2]|uniref:non-specific serine/threonine protein kinase n=1 Tax=Coniophora puteana (strain RWD-64-598) TaxID=741705 RepID=A0A5M3N2U8_CONPW|nr:kinase-like protein [Coniophora puteana RWD-64-598 SS2]EIW85710.1 kinase-like protein [Coniophora puteana RWD-64-598 SS2]
MNIIRSIFRTPKRSTTIDDENPASFIQREQQCSESSPYAPLLGNAKMLGWEFARKSSDVRAVDVKYNHPCGVPAATIKISRKWCLSSSSLRSSTSAAISDLNPSNVGDAPEDVFDPPGLQDAGQRAQTSHPLPDPDTVILLSQPEVLEPQPIRDEPLEYADPPSAAVIPPYTVCSHATGPTARRRQTSLLVNAPDSGADLPQSSARIDRPSLLPVALHPVRFSQPGIQHSVVPQSAEPRPQAAQFCVRFKGNAQRFTVLKSIGNGTFGSVVYARTDERREVAIKIVNKRKLLASKVLRRNVPREWVPAYNRAAADDILGELTALHLITSRPNASPFLTPMLNAWTDENNVYFVMRMYPFNLRQVLKDTPLSPEQTRVWGAELLLGLEYLHYLGVIHRDLKPENILVTPSGHLAIADFGLAAVLPPQQSIAVSNCVGTPGYLAPEQHDGRIPRGGYSYGVDVYAYGLVLMEMVLGDGKRWWSSFDHECTMGMTYQEHQPTPFDVIKRVDAKDWLAGLFIRRLVQDNPQHRPRWVDARTFGFFNDLDWTRVAERKYQVFQAPCVLPHAKEHFKAPDDGQRFFMEMYSDAERQYVEDVMTTQRAELQGLGALTFDYEYPKIMWKDSEHGETCLQVCHHGHELGL